MKYCHNCGKKVLDTEFQDETHVCNNCFDEDPKFNWYTFWVEREE